MNWIKSVKAKYQEILELLFSEHMQKHIVPETVKYAQIFQNEYTFDTTEFDLRCYVGTLFLSGYYSLPQQSSLLGEESWCQLSHGISVH